MSNGTRIIRASRGPAFMQEGWLQEAAVRMPLNSLSPDVIEPDVAGTIRCAARLHADGHHAATGAAPRAGVQNTFDIRGFVPEYVRPLYCDGIGPSGGAALSGDPGDIALTGAAARVKTLQTRLVVPVDRVIMTAGTTSIRDRGVAESRGRTHAR